MCVGIHPACRFSVYAPREKLFKHGPKYLADAELLAILLRTGHRRTSEQLAVLELAKKLLKEKSLNNLFRSTAEELRQITGLGPAKIATVLAAGEIAYRAYQESSQPGDKILNPTDGCRLFSDLGRLEQETVAIAILSPGNRLIVSKHLFRGLPDSAPCSISYILREVLRTGFRKFLIAHNHPSGDPSPSEQDSHFTDRLLAACDLVGLELVDHLILCERTRYYSFAAAGNLHVSSLRTNKYPSKKRPAVVKQEAKDDS